MLIFCATPYDSFEIWVWIYICHVFDVQQLNFLIVESLYTMIVSDITPPDWSEFPPIVLGSIPLYCSLRSFAAVLTALKMSPLVTSAHASLRQTPQSRLSSVPLLLSMCCTLRYRVATDPLFPVVGFPHYSVFLIGIF